MIMESKILFFLRSVAVTLAYGLAYLVLRKINISSISHMDWIPMAWLRFTCLLCVPTRYWLALVVGEAIPIGYQNYVCLDLFGWAWTLTGSVPPMIYAAAIVHLVRRQVPDFEKHISQNIGTLLLCMFLVSLAVGLHDMLNYSLLKQFAPGEQPMPFWLYGLRRIIGNYLSILTVTPILLWVAEGLRQTAKSNRRRLRVLADALQKVPWRTTSCLLTTIVLFVVMGHYFGEAMHVLTLCGIVAVLVVTAARYDAQSAALVGAGANLGVIALMPTRDDPLTILAQCMIAALTTCTLLLGARTTTSRMLMRGVRLAEHSAQLAEQSAAAARRLARRELFAMERVRLNYAAVLDDVFETMHGRAIRMMHEAHSALPLAKLDAYYQDFEALHQEHLRITGALAPRRWHLFDGKESPIVEVLNQIGVQCQIFDPCFETDPQGLSLELHPALHRLKCEAVVYLMKHAPSNVLRLQLAVRMRNDQHVAEVSLASIGTPIRLSQTMYEDLLKGLGVIYTGERRLRNRAQLYGGDVKVVRTSPYHLRLVVQVAN